MRLTRVSRRPRVWAFSNTVSAKSAQVASPGPVMWKTTADYPAAARRPANCRLDNGKLRRVYGLALPEWRASLAVCCARLLD
jgi:dTDP-4-dehydrorhamnose reductase